MQNNAKMLGDGSPKPTRFVRDLGEPEDFYNFWVLSETDAKTAVEIAPAKKFVYRPTLADLRIIGTQAAFSLWHNPVLLSLTCFLIGCLAGLILGYTAKP